MIEMAYARQVSFTTFLQVFTRLAICTWYMYLGFDGNPNQSGLPLSQGNDGIQGKSRKFYFQSGKIKGK